MKVETYLLKFKYGYMCTLLYNDKDSLFTYYTDTGNILDHDSLYKNMLDVDILGGMMMLYWHRYLSYN